jgi:hypothetical protein
MGVSAFGLFFCLLLFVFFFLLFLFFLPAAIAAGQNPKRMPPKMFAMLIAVSDVKIRW